MPEKVRHEPPGLIAGSVFNDGVHDVVRKVSVGVNAEGITYLRTEYEDDDGGVVIKENGDLTGSELHEFQLSYPDEYIISVTGTYRYVEQYGTNMVKTLFFRTSHARRSPLFGRTHPSTARFELKGLDGAKLLGFHGRSGDMIAAIGAYFFTCWSSRLMIGGWIRNGDYSGVYFDDGVYDGISKVSVGVTDGWSEIQYLKLEYVKGEKLIQHSHGKAQDALVEEFVLDYPNEYITSLDFAYQGGFFKALTIVTSTGRKSQQFGKMIGTILKVEQDGRKLVGLRGRYNYNDIRRFIALEGWFASPGEQNASKLPEDVGRPEEDDESRFERRRFPLSF